MRHTLHRVNIRELSRELKINPATLYRALDEDAPVKPETRRRILNELTRRGVQINTVRPRRIVVDLRPNDHYMTSLALELLQLLPIEQFNYKFSHAGTDRGRFMRAVEESDAVVFFSYPSEEILAAAREANPDAFQIVFGNSGGGDVAIDSDNTDGGVAAARYLYERGHRDILLGTAYDQPNHRNRYRGFAGELQYLDRNAQAEFLLHSGRENWNDPAVFQERLKGKTAFVALSGIMVCHVWIGLNRAGIRVPEDVSLFCFDNPVGDNNGNLYHVWAGCPPLPFEVSRLESDRTRLLSEIVFLLNELPGIKGRNLKIQVPLRLIEGNSVINRKAR